MRQHDSDPLVSLGGQRVARALKLPAKRVDDAATIARRKAELEKLAVEHADQIAAYCDASEAEAWKDLVEALTDYGPRHPDSLPLRSADAR